MSLNRIDDGEVLTMAQPGTHQRLKPSAGLEFIEPAQSPKDPLARLPRKIHALGKVCAPQVAGAAGAVLA